MPEHESEFKPPLERREVEFATDLITYKNVLSVLKIVRDTREAPA